MEVAIKGLNELQKQFRQFSREMHNELKKTLRDNVKQVAKEARNNAPVDTGKYRDSITSRVSASGVIAWAFADRKKKEGEKGKGGRGYIGHLLEYGTKRAKARKHFTPALEKVKAGFGKDLEDAVKRVKGIGAFR
ncbi:MAG: HK97 gp10 family phage protein [Candidatus Riflebacteria bacterium]|nr:HK97 gp10 family phage protein [Candidatus Riflebacteria bacterium]